MGERIVLGLGNNVDCEILWNTEVMEYLTGQYKIHENEIGQKRDIETERDLILSILDFMRRGVGGERFVKQASVLQKFSDRFEKKETLGGTSVRAALAMRKMGVTSFLHLVSINDVIKGLLPANCSYICSSNEKESSPHLVLQYAEGMHIRVADTDIIAKRANRIIYTHDRENMEMLLHPALADKLKDASVFLISGFNTMCEKNVLEKRLDELLHIMKSLPESAEVFYEDGCFHIPEFTQVIWDKLLPDIDIYSMNEDELQDYVGHKLNLYNVKDVWEALQEVHQKIPVKMLLVHTSGWSLVYGNNAARYKDALQSGNIMAGTRYQYGDSFQEKDYWKTAEMQLQPLGVQFSSEIEKLASGRICCKSCIRADVKNPVTIGLGDSFVGGFLMKLS